MTIFKVNYNVGPTETTGKTVPVFLKPQNPQRSYRINAWQVQTTSAGGTESFDYNAVMSTGFSATGVNDNQIVPARQTIAPDPL